MSWVAADRAEVTEAIIEDHRVALDSERAGSLDGGALRRLLLND